MISAFAQSLRRLWLKGSKAVTEAKLQEYLASGKISQEEYNYITAPAA